MIYSNSALSTFRQCPRKFKYRYIEKLEGAEKSEALKNGIKVHEDIENGVENDKTRYALNIVKGLSKLEVSVMMKDGQEHKVFLNKKTPYLQIQEDKFGLDSSWKPCAFDASICRIRGKVDLIRAEINRQKMLAHVGEELIIEDFVEKVRITDWKTGKKNNSEGKRQLFVYSIYYFTIFPNMQEIECNLVYLDQPDDKKEEIYKITRGEAEIQKKELEEKMTEIDNTTVFKCVRTPLCNYCEYKDKCFEENKVPSLVASEIVAPEKIDIVDILNNL